MVWPLGVQAEEIGRSAAELLVQSLSDGGCVDEHLQDQVRNRRWTIMQVNPNLYSTN